MRIYRKNTCITDVSGWLGMHELKKGKKKIPHTPL